MKLRTLLLLTFVPFVSVSLLAGMLYLNAFAAEHYRAQQEQKLLALSAIAKQRVLSVMKGIHDNTALIASRTQLRLSLQQWNQAPESAQQLKMQKILTDATDSLHELKSVCLFDRDGQMVVAVNEAFQPGIVPAPPKIPEKAELIRSGDMTQVMYSLPLVLDGETLGQIVVKYDADFLYQLVLDRTGLGDSGEWLFAMRDDNGHALFVTPLKYDQSPPFTRRIAKQQVDVPITQALLGREILMGEAPDYMGTKVMAATRYIPDYDWGLVVKISEAEVQQLVDSMRFIIYWHEGVVVVLAILFGTLLTRRIARPLERLQEHTAAVMEGEVVPHNAGTCWQEVKVLTSHVNQMVTVLTDYNKNLRHMVARRTRELAEAKRQLEQLVIRDPLTGVYNRRYFTQKLEEECLRAHRDRHGLAVVMIDVDYFKSINDCWGHDVGDQVLVSLCACIQDCIREVDTLARIGGEEFCLLLPETKRVVPLLERIRHAVSTLTIETETEALNITISLGWTRFDASSTEPGLLMKQADEALYAAKKAGRNQVCGFYQIQGLREGRPQKAAALLPGANPGAAQG